MKISILEKLQNEKVTFGSTLSGVGTCSSAPTMAGVDVDVSISLPPPIVFAAPPEVIVIPETYVYVVPDVDADIFFYNGWWWRPWEGRWYRSRYYNSGWGYYQSVPSFYRGIPSGWRNDYRDHRWGGHPWNYQRIPHQQLQQNWSSWEKNRHWEKQQTWGVQGLKPTNASTTAVSSGPAGNSGKTAVREAANHNNRDRNPERSNHSNHSHNTRKSNKNPNLERENLNKGRKKNRIESRMIKRLFRCEESAIDKSCRVEQENI